MAGPESLLRASVAGAAQEFAYADVARHGAGKPHVRDGELLELHTGSSAAIDLVEGSLALLPVDHEPAGHDQQEAVAAFAAPVPAAKRFAVWSLRYLMVLAGAEAVIGGAAAAIPASMSDSVSANQAVPLFCLIGLLLWPAAIGLSRGYRRARVGVGSAEFRAVVVAGTVMLALSALPAGFSPNLAAASPLSTLLKVAAVGAPIAIALSLTARLLARRLLHRQQQRGEHLRHVVLAGSAAAAQQLAERIQRAPHGVMRVIGLCLPSEQLPRPVVGEFPVLGNLDEV